MKVFGFSALIALLAGLLISWWWEPEPLDDRLVRLQVEQLYPAYAHELRHEPIELQAQLIDYADDPILSAKARVALQRYPDMARPILLLYGTEIAFQTVLREYGEHVIPPIHYFLSHDIRSLAWTNGVTNAAQSVLAAVGRLRAGEEGMKGSAERAAAELTADERGRYAVLFIEQEGHDFLGQFVVRPDGQVSWIQTERVLEGISSFLASGLRGVETKLRLDESVGVADVGWAAVDVAIGVSVIKVLRMGRAGVATTQSMNFSQRTAALGSSLLRGSRVGVRLAKYGAPVALAYLAVRHPSMLNSLFGRIAEWADLPARFVQVLGWSLVLLPVLVLLQILLRPVALLLMGCGKVLRWSHARIRGKNTGDSSMASNPIPTP